MIMSLKFKLPEGWSTFFLLNGMLLSLAWSIQAAGWVEGLDRLPWVIVVALALGLLLAKSRLSDPSIHILSALLGTSWAVYLTGTLLPGDLDWHQRIIELAERLSNWIEKALTGGTSGDNLLLVLQLAVLLWWLGYSCAWFTFRWPRIWWVLIPSGMAMFFNLYWAPTRLNLYFALYLFCALLLGVRRNVRFREWQWQARGIGYKPDIGYHFLRAGAIFSLLVLLAVWSLPIAGVNARLIAAWERFHDPWQGLRAYWNRLYSALNYYPTRQTGFSPSNRSLELGGPLQLSDEPIMDIWAENRGYWRAEVYDTYAGRNWINTERYLASLEAGVPLSRTGYKLRREVNQTVRLLRGGTNVIYVSSQPVRVDLPLWVVLGSPSIENVLMLYSLSDLETDQTYTVVSSISQADVDSLRTTNNEYPAWVADRYLQLPATLPRRVRILAQNLTRRYDNAYDKIEALGDYLRHIPYNDEIEAPPEGQDSVDYFLFEARQGYCSYYASALVVMARSLGIPARPVSGYKCERYRAETGACRVLELDAHAWVEVYFPDYGWIEFEPTPSEPLIKRPEHEDETQTKPKEDKTGDHLRDDQMSDLNWGGIDLSSGLASLTRWGSEKGTVYWVGIGMLFLALAGGGTILWWRGREKRRTLNGAERAYASLLHWTGRLGLGRQAYQTPHEHASILAQALPQGQEPLSRLVDLYVKERFGAGGLSELEQEGVRQAWHRLRPILRSHLWRQRLRLPRLGSRLRSG